MRLTSLLIPGLFILLGFLCSYKHTPAQQNADCASAFWVGNQYKLHVVNVRGIGTDHQEANTIPCFFNGNTFGQAEVNSTWLRFAIDKPGTLRFTILPDTTKDDYDFVLFRLPQHGDCAQKEVVRCMAASPSGKETGPDSPCFGPTGLIDDETDITEDAGCSDPDDNNWLKPLEVQAGEQYVLLLSNISGPFHGCTVRFWGDFTFKENPE